VLRARNELCVVLQTAVEVWQPKYGGMDASMTSQMKALEDQNRRLKKMYAEMSMQAELLKDALGKK
jgi:putative transposase